jgi:hypothetical protein
LYRSRRLDKIEFAPLFLAVAYIVSKRKQDIDIVVWTRPSIIANVRLVFIVMCIGTIMVEAVRTILR